MCDVNNLWMTLGLQNVSRYSIIINVPHQDRALEHEVTLLCRGLGCYTRIVYTQQFSLTQASRLNIVYLIGCSASNLEPLFNYNFAVPL